nr:ABC transporter ATP-binding protein [uncultured Desulfuromonas sp.]
MIRFADVCKVYPAEIGSKAHIAMKNVSFSLNKGETLGLVGMNGAGKSTCIHLLMNFIHPEEGQIEIFGKSPDCSLLRQNIGYLPEVVCFPINLTIMDMLYFAGVTCALTKFEIKKRAESILGEVGLWDVRRRPLRSYSKGMQQRASLAVALIADPDLLILDEPMSGLDPIGREQMISLVQRLQRQGKTILFCSHLLEDVDRLADRLLVLHRGEKCFDGTIKGLCAQQEKSSLNEAFLSLIQDGYGV